MRIAPLLVSATVAVATPAPAHAVDGAIGVSAPLSETAELLGAQLVDGAKTAAATSPHRPVALEIADDRCSAEGGAAAAEQFVAADVAIVTGFLCTEAIEAALPILKEAGIPVITPGVRTTSLTDQRYRTGWPVYRMAPRADAEQAAVSKILVNRWRDELFAIIDDGTIYGRELAESLRAGAELAGLEPVMFDTFRPQLDNQIAVVGRLRRAGATHVFVGGDRRDIAIMARDAAELDYDATFAGGETLRTDDADVPLARGVLMVAPPRWASIAPQDVLDAFAEAGIMPEGYVIPSYAAVQLAAAALAFAQEEGVSVREILDTTAFSTAIGALRFDDKGDVSRDFHRLFRYDGRQFVEVE